MVSLKLKIPPVIVVLLCGALMWLTDRWLIIEPLTFETNWWLYALFLIAGFWITSLGVRTFSSHQTTTHPQHLEKATVLVQSGIYRYSRNPMYLGMLLILLSGVFYFGNWATIIALPLYVWYMNRFQIIPEEEVMQQKFRGAYMEYKSQVRRWV